MCTSAIVVLGGGVYFVRQTYHEDCTGHFKTAVLILRLYSQGSRFFTLIPVELFPKTLQNVNTILLLSPLKDLGNLRLKWAWIIYHTISTHLDMEMHYT